MEITDFMIFVSEISNFCDHNLFYKSRLTNKSGPFIGNNCKSEVCLHEILNDSDFSGGLKTAKMASANHTPLV